ncbi:MAG: PHB depolymerase family esterase [Candidatus Binatia bacterium]
MRLLIAVLLLAAAPAAGEPLPSAGCARTAIDRGRRLERTIDVVGTPRQVILDVPEAVRAGVPAPVLLDFHGFGHSGAGVWEVSGFRALAEREGFITAYPQGLPVTLHLRGQDLTNAGWQVDVVAGNRDLAFTAALLDQIERDYCVDRRRLYATGFSNGAWFSQLLACAMADRIAAVAPVSGGTLRVDCQPSRPVSILIQHGSADDLVPVAADREVRDRWRALNGCPADAQADGATCQRWSACRADSVVAYCEEPYAHRWPPQGSERVWAFLSSKRLP